MASPPQDPIVAAMFSIRTPLAPQPGRRIRFRPAFQHGRKTFPRTRLHLNAEQTQESRVGKAHIGKWGSHPRKARVATDVQLTGALSGRAKEGTLLAVLLTHLEPKGQQ